MKFTEQLSRFHTPLHIRSRLKESFDGKHKAGPKETGDQILARIKKEAETKARQSEFKVKKAETRAKYFDLMAGQTNLDEVGRLTQLLDEQQFTYALNAETGDVENIDWETKEQDFAAFSVLIQRLRDTVHLTDEQFRSVILDIIDELVIHSPLYARLNNDNIRRSEAHIDNPLQHTISVGINTITTGLEPWKVLWARLNFVIHDLGKIGKAFGDHTNVHAEKSFRLWLEYFLEHALDEFNVPDEKIKRKLIELFLSPVRYHHLPEAVQFEAFTEQEAFSLIMYDPISLEERQYIEDQKQINPAIHSIKPEETMLMLGVLSSADAASVDRYVHFAVSNAALYFSKIFSQLDEIDKDTFPKEYFAKFHEWLLKMFIAVNSEYPAGMLSEIRDLKDPVFKSGEFSFGPQQLKDVSKYYLEYLKFIRRYGIDN
jgi:hypothetical protein